MEGMIAAVRVCSIGEMSGCHTCQVAKGAEARQPLAELSTGQGHFPVVFAAHFKVRRAWATFLASQSRLGINSGRLIGFCRISQRAQSDRQFIRGY